MNQWGGVYHKTVKKEIKSKLIDIALEVHGRVKCTRLAGSDLIAAFLCQMVDSMNGRSCLRASFYATNICKFSSLAPFSLSTLKLSCIFGPQQVQQTKTLNNKQGRPATKLQTINKQTNKQTN